MLLVNGQLENVDEERVCVILAVEDLEILVLLGTGKGRMRIAYIFLVLLKKFVIFFL